MSFKGVDSIIAMAGSLVGLGIQSGTAVYTTKIQTKAQEEMFQEQTQAETERFKIGAKTQAEIEAITLPAKLERERTIKQVALYGGIALVLSAAIITVGTMTVSKKGQ